MSFPSSDAPTRRMKSSEIILHRSKDDVVLNHVPRNRTWKTLHPIISRSVLWNNAHNKKTPALLLKARVVNELPGIFSGAENG